MMTTSIEAQFNLVSKTYDENRKKFIPCFDKFYKGTAEIIARLNDNPKTIVDLGAGTGLNILICPLLFFSNILYNFSDAFPHLFFFR